MRWLGCLLELMRAVGRVSPLSAAAAAAEIGHKLARLLLRDPGQGRMLLPVGG